MDNIMIRWSRNVGCLRHYTWRHFRSSLVEYFTVAVYTNSGKLELHVLACSTVHANEMDIEKKNNFGKPRGKRSIVIACPVQKFYPRQYHPVCHCCVTLSVAMPGDMFCLWKLPGQGSECVLSIIFPGGLPKGSISWRHLLQWLIMKALTAPSTQSSNVVHI